MTILRTIDGTPLQLQPTLRSRRRGRRRRGHNDGVRRKPDGDEATDGTSSETRSPDSSENSTSSFDRCPDSIPASLIFTCQPPSPASTTMCKNLSESDGLLLSTVPGGAGRTCLPDLILSQLSEETNDDYDDDNDCLDASIAGSITVEHLEIDDAIERDMLAKGPRKDIPSRHDHGGEDSNNNHTLSHSCLSCRRKCNGTNHNKSLRFLDQVSESLITHEHTIPRVTDVEALYYSETDLAQFREEYNMEKAAERAAGQLFASQERMSGSTRRTGRPRNVGTMADRRRGITRQAGMRNLGLRGSIRVVSAADLAYNSEDDDSTDRDDESSNSDEEKKINQIDFTKLRGRPGILDFPLSVPLSVMSSP
mmetsp:Transcript_24337/g.57850  ORF Transcript_24337/g.57850 Transcript_24337/m.57850 type:complete len:366 (+) Transcript_24337:253-1350(+)